MRQEKTSFGNWSSNKKPNQQWIALRKSSIPPADMALPPPRFDCRPMSPRMPLPMNPLFGGYSSMRQSLSSRSHSGIQQPNGSLPFLQPRAYGTMPPVVPRGARISWPPIIQHCHRRIPPPQMIPPVRSKFVTDNDNVKDKAMINMKINKLQVYLQPNNKRSHNPKDESNVGFEDNTLYYCGVCDRDFSSEDALTEHKSTHKLCGIDGCMFSAHPLLVEKHINMQHSTGLYARMKDLSGEEGIKKWIDERKKRFPTKSNIKLREVENLEKLQRGETIKQNRHIFKTTKMTNVRGKKRKPHKRLTRKTDDYPHIDELYRGLRPFPGINIYLQEENSSEVCLDKETKQMDLRKEITDNISDEDDNTLQVFMKSKPANLSRLSLVANYESGSEEEDDYPEEVSIKRTKMEDFRDYKIAENITVLKETLNNTQSCTNVSEDKSNYQTVANKVLRHSVNKHQDKQKHKTNQTVEDKNHEKVSTRHRSSLLQMLLARSIQHERNLIFQCLKYIVDKDFFESSGSGM